LALARRFFVGRIASLTGLTELVVMTGLFVFLVIWRLGVVGRGGGV